MLSENIKITNRKLQKRISFKVNKSHKAIQNCYMVIFHLDFKISISNNTDLESTYFFMVFLEPIYTVVLHMTYLMKIMQFLKFSFFQFKSDKLQSG